MKKQFIKKMLNAVGLCAHRHFVPVKTVREQHVNKCGKYMVNAQ